MNLEARRSCVANASAIANHLNIKISRIKSATEWANCLFVVVKGLGARFVSKKVVKMEKPWIEKAQEKIDLCNRLDKNPFNCYASIDGKKAAYWASELILEFNCGMDEELVELLFNNIDNHKPASIKFFKKKIQDGLDEAAFWEAENAKMYPIWDAAYEKAMKQQEDERQQWLKDEASKELGFQKAEVRRQEAEGTHV